VRSGEAASDRGECFAGVEFGARRDTIGEVQMLRRKNRLWFASLLFLAAPAIRAAAVPVELTFKPCDGMICLPVTLADGKSHWLLLDTGNVNSWLLADAARAMHLKLDVIEQDGKKIDGIFRIGAQTVLLQKQPMAARFLAFEKEQVGDLPSGVDGALAYTFFTGRVLKIDYPHHRLSVLDAPSNGLTAVAAPLHLITFGKAGPPVVVGSGFSVNGRPVSAQVDTCFTGTLLVYDQAIADLGLQDSPDAGPPKFFPNTDGGVNMKEVAIDSIGFGGRMLSPRPATIYLSAPGKNLVHQPDGLFEGTVGNALFAHSIVVLDLQSMKIDVRPG
jgi:hypothetical protein